MTINILWPFNVSFFNNSLPSPVGFDFILPAEVDLLFDDISRYKSNCKYSDCLHINENGCNVLSHIEEIDNTRYESYLAFVEEAKDYTEKIKNEGKKEEHSIKVVHNKQVAKISEKKRTAKEL